jgi:membrane protein DedA with SNARE-associated domain
MVQGFVEHFTYLGIFTVLLLSGVGVPIPEEGTVIAAGVLSQQGAIRWGIALPVTVLGVLSGDVILYWAGWHWGEQVVNWRVVRCVLTPERERWLKAAYHRHAAKTVFMARHIMGIRAAAFLTAGIARVPFWKFFAVDAGSSLVSVPFAFGLSYLFADQVTDILRDVRRTERWIGLAIVVALALGFTYILWRERRRVAALGGAGAEDVSPPAGKRPEGSCRERAS